MRKRMKKVSALILAVSLLCSAFVLPEVYAATRVETERKDCSIVVSLANNVYSEEGATEFRELEMLKVDVDLYKVATIAENGKYTAVDTYKDVTVFPQIEGKENSFGEWINKKLDSKTPAGDWADVAKMLKPVAETTSVTKKGSMEAGQSSVKIENLETGLYLVNAHAEKSENYEYQFMPYLISLLFQSFIQSRFVITLLEGLVRLAIFIGYVSLVALMPEIKRTYMYHGAEHKCINCIENGMELNLENVKKSSKQHKRCGTSFLFFVMVVSVIVCFFITVDSKILRIVLRLALLPVIAGISYEIIRLAGSSSHPLVELLSKPGLAMQNLTTKEPEDDMIEVAIKAVEEVFDWKTYLKENFKENQE